MVLKACAILLTVIVTLVPLCESFVLNENNRWIVLPRRQTHSPIKKKFFPLFGMLDSSSGTNDKEDDDDNDVEVQRQRLAALFGGGPSTSSGSITENTPSVSSSSVLPPDWEYQLENPPPLTAIGRERAVAEIELLQKLKDNDEPMEELWQLWYNSRGPETAKKLQATDTLMGQGPAGWVQAEQQLRELVFQEGIYFVEAINRLATVLFLLKRFKESKEVCELVLTIKPWHFGALSGIVGVCHGLGDRECMIDWAKEQMPRLESKSTFFMGSGVSGESRADWVDRMVIQAKQRLKLAEKGVKISFRDLDSSEEEGGVGNYYYGSNTPPEIGGVLPDEEDAWQ